MPDRNKNFQEAIISPEATILDALKAIDRSSLQIALIVDRNNHLKGTVTDGDIRRGIISGRPLEAPVTTIMNVNPKTIDLHASSAEVLAFMAEKAIHQIPVVNETGQLMGLQRMDELVAARKTKKEDVWIVLMLGGEGRRLRPLTNDIPKPMIPVGDRPLLETILRNFTRDGFTNFFFSVNYKAEIIQDYFGDGSRFGANITYMKEDRRMGTAGALGLLPGRPPGPVIVMNGDILTSNSFSQLIDYHDQTGSLATMCVSEYNHKIPYGIVQANGSKLGSLQEKPLQSYFINAGIYVLEPEALGYVPDGELFDMPGLFEALSEKGFEAAVFPIRDYWVDIGQMEDLKKARAEYEKVFR